VKAKFKENDTVIMTQDAVDNYGLEYLDCALIVMNVSTSTEDHPGYDESMEGMGLYDLRDKNTGEDLGFSLYDYELI